MIDIDTEYSELSIFLKDNNEVLGIKIYYDLFCSFNINKLKNQYQDFWLYLEQNKSVKNQTLQY